ncbi:FKBP-type peptidyl-prolyl cis-trans isomerase [Pasteurella sp. PK-2025]|uniref:FKBP-type peptidyl-prolyl cis-trans isomerase n=1 Tax=Pasteurella sp. PK-2025 TaxID=3413133 RepID=UPI003C715612
MFKIQKYSMLALFVGAVVSQATLAETKNTDKQFHDEASYALGTLLGTNLKAIIDSQKDIVNYDHKKVLAGVEDVLNGKVELAKSEKLQQTLQNIQTKLEQEQQAQIKKIGEQAKSEGEKYRANFAKQKDVKKTASGLLYKIVSEGQGEVIKPTDKVTVNYTGKLPNGDVFDSSRGKPISFKLNQVVAGWTEGLQLVKKGGKIELVLPPELAYGEQGAGTIPPNATLHFDVDVIDVKSE